MWASGARADEEDEELEKIRRELGLAGASERGDDQ
jgi:hypothetical protein